MQPFLNAFRLVYLAQDTDMYRNKYMPNGLRPVEAFHSDISRNLIKWAVAGDAEYYETNDYWYCFRKENTEVGSMAGIVWMRRFSINSSETICVFESKRDLRGLSKKWSFDLHCDNMVPAK